VAGFRILIDQFLDSDPSSGKQIVSFGAGYDTNFFRLQARQQVDPAQKAPVKYFELDFPHVVKHKTKLIMQAQKLSSCVQQLSLTSDGGISGTNYALCGVDLHKVEQVEAALVVNGISKHLPTLFLSECVLIYVSPDKSAELIKWTHDFFHKGMFIVYEQIKPYDAFGEVMLRNLEARGVPLTSIKKYPDLESQKKRFLELGYTHIDAKDMNDIFKVLLSPTENQRLAKIEIFDEYEEWTLIQAHYCIVVSTFDKESGEGKKGIWEGVKLCRA